MSDARERLEALRDSLADRALYTGEGADHDNRRMADAILDAKPEGLGLLVGIQGRAFDPPEQRRAYTYAEQPDNVSAARLGAVSRAATGADSTDQGLALLKALQEQGFGVFELPKPQENDE